MLFVSVSMTLLIFLTAFQQYSAKPKTQEVPYQTAATIGAVAGVGRVGLDWDDSPEGDLSNYNVYRSETSGGPYVMVNRTQTEPSRFNTLKNGIKVTESSYEDNGLRNEVTYYYVLTAIDVAGNESAYSNEAFATTLPPPVP